MTENAFRADIAVLGGGPAGYAAALRAVRLGKTVTLIEGDALGGTCLHRGCVPTKALLRVGEVADLTRSAARYGVQAEFAGVDIARAHEFKRATVDRFHTGLQGLLRSSGITVVEGRGRLENARTLRVGDNRVEADSIVLATGSEPIMPASIPIGGRILTSDQALTLETLPQRVAVLGGGVIGVEFASLWASLGVAVTIIEALPCLLPTEDVDVSRALARAFRRRKIGARTSTTVTAVEQDADEVQVHCATGEPVSADYLLVAVGRRPRTADLGLEQVGISLDNGFIKTDARLQTSVPGIYAVGDLVAGPQLAHRGFAHGMFVAEELAGLAPQPVDDTSVPRIVYCHPEVAAVGLTEERARDLHGDTIRVARHDLGGNAKSHLIDTAGTVKVIAHEDGRVLGVHMVGDRVGELIGEAQLLYGLDVDAHHAAPLVHAHPTQGEALGEALLALAGKPFHTQH
jgi:dihydrolipoamide dehydrogenase